MPRAVQVADRVEDLVDQDGREAHRRLVEEQDLGVGHQAAAHGQHLLLATAERPGDLVLALLEAREQGERPLDPFRDGGLVLDDEGAHLEVLGHGQPGEDPASLRDLDDALGHDLVGRDFGRDPRRRAGSGPDCGRTRPLIELSVVLLPAPLPPMRATISPWMTSSEMPAQGVDAAVEGVDVLDRQDRRRGTSIRPPSAARPPVVGLGARLVLALAAASAAPSRPR